MQDPSLHRAQTDTAIDMSDYISHEYMMSIPAREVSDSSRIAANPVVSVIIHAYNHETYIAQAIEGVIRQQSRFPIELLIGEDCSLDGTRTICLEYQRRYPHIIRLIIADLNVGAHNNSLRLFARARGRYLAFCDGDDYWTNSCKLQMQVAFFEANSDHTLCFHNAQVTYQDADTKPHLSNRKLPVTLSAAKFIERERQIPTASMVFRRSVITRLPEDFCTFPNGDLPLCILAAAAGKVHGLAECLSVYRKHQGGASYSTAVAAEHGIQYWERVNTMLASLDRTLQGSYHRSFQKRIRHNRRKIDYVRLKHGMRFSPRILWNSLRYQIEDKFGW